MSTASTVKKTKDPAHRVQGKPNLFSNRNFTWLAAGQAISNIGDFVYSTTLLIWLYTLTHSTAAVSGGLVAEYAPILVLGPLAGVFVDRWHRLRTMLCSDLARMVIALLPLLAPDSLRLPAIYASIFLISGIGRLFMPALAGVRQVIVPQEDQARAASITQVTQALAIILGPALASPLYAGPGPLIAILINAGSYAVSAFCIWRMRVPRADLLPAEAHATGEQSGRGVRAVLLEMRAGLAFVLKTRVLVILFLLMMVGMFGAGTLNALDIVFVSQRLHTSTALYGYFNAVGGVGMLIGALCAALVAKRVQPRHMLTGSMLGIGLGLTLYALQTSPWPALCLIFLYSIPQGTLNVGMMPLFMSVTPRHLMGRVSALFNTLNFAASLLSMALSGFLGTFVPVYLLFLANSLLIVLVGLIGLFTLPASTESEQVEN